MNLLDRLIPSCSVCGKPLLAFAYQDWEGNKVCMEHKDCMCNSCGRTYGKRAKEVEPHVWLCESCATHMPNKKAVKSIIAYIRTFYKQKGLAVNPHIKLRGVAIAQMERENAANVRGYVMLPPDTDGYTVVVLRHLSRTVLAFVLAHEMLHIWQHEHHIYPPAPITEGFCNLGAYLALQSIGTKVAEGQILLLSNNTDPIYGDGFRKMKEMYENQGLSAVIRYMHSFKR